MYHSHLVIWSKYKFKPVFKRVATTDVDHLRSVSVLLTCGVKAWMDRQSDCQWVVDNGTKCRSGRIIDRSFGWRSSDHHSLVVTQQDVYIIIIIIPVYSSILQTHRSVSISCLFIDKMRRDKSTRDWWFYCSLQETWIFSSSLVNYILAWPLYEMIVKRMKIWLW